MFIANEEDSTFLVKLYQDYYGCVYRNIKKRTNNSNDAEDLANDTFLKLADKVPLLRTFSSCELTAYVVYTARSVASNYNKHKGVQNKHMFFGEKDDIALDIYDREDSIEDKIVSKEEKAVLVNAILKLPEKYKNLLYFKYILEKSDEEIAKILSIAPHSVRQYLTRARREARKIMEKEMTDSGEKNTGSK